MVCCVKVIVKFMGHDFGYFWDIVELVIASIKGLFASTEPPWYRFSFDSIFVSSLMVTLLSRYYMILF